MASEVEQYGEDIRTGSPGGRRSSLEIYSLTILIKLLKLTDPEAVDEEERLKLLLNCGKSSVKKSGTLASLNKEKLGNVIGLQSNVQQFVRFLNESTIEVTLARDETTVGKGQLRLQDTRVAHFDLHREDGQPVLEEFPLHDGTDKQIGVVTMVLRAERNAPPVGPSSDGQLDTDDIMYVVNEERRRTAEQQEALQRQLLLCDKCNVLRSPEDFSCQYELVDGILHNKAVSSTEKEIERIKQKVQGVALDEMIGQRESFSTNGGDGPGGKICGLCRGLTITGLTCRAAPETAGSIGTKPSTGRDEYQRPQACKETAPRPKTARATTNDPGARCCERCKTCLNWLPEVCRCPKCGHRTYDAKNAENAVNQRRRFLNSPSDVGMGTEKANSPIASGSNTMIASSQSCPICHVRQCRCVDCVRRVHRSGPCSSYTGTSEILFPGYGAAERPVTRRSNGDRLRRTLQGEVGPSGKRPDQLRQAYGAKAGGLPPNGKARLSGTQIRKNYNAFIRKVKQQNRNLYSYRFGRRHPGMVVGHKACMKQEQLVPAHMGWRWNTCTVGIGKRRPGWRPGAVRKPIMQLMQHFLKCYPTDNVPVSSGKKAVSCQPPSTNGQPGGQKPTLHITKQHGEYSITMNPLKDSDTLKTATDPYLPCKPIKFRLSKDPRLTKLYLLREELKAKGFALCGCRELEHCEHRAEREKRLLVEEIRRTAKRFGLPLETSVADLPSRSESELDVEFTPPSAVLRPDEKRPDVVYAETQYCVEDFKLKPVTVEKPKPSSKRTTGGARSKEVLPAGKVPPIRAPGVVKVHGKGDGAAGAPESGGGKKSAAGGNVPGRKSAGTLPKGGAKGTPVEAGVKSTGVRISVAKAKGSSRK